MSETTHDHDGVESIKEVPDPALRQTAKPVPKVTRTVKDLMDSLVTIMEKAYGIGLAAPQIGVRKRVIAVSIEGEPACLANPEVVESEGSQESWEGCLSVPGFIGLVERPMRVTVTGLDQSGRKVWLEAEGLEARALLHEIDHLDGVLFLDRAQKIEELPPASRLRLVFMGTPEFAREHLSHLVASGCRVMAVVTQPDRPRGRGHRLQPTPVKAWAQERDLEVMSPHSIRDEEAISRLEYLEPDVIVTCAYGQILPRRVLDIPRWGAVNVHASLLPRYRGAAPIQRALMAGERTSGVTIMLMDEDMDTGPVLAQEELDIEPDENAGTLHDRLASLGADLLFEVLNDIARGTGRAEKQGGAASYAPRLRREEMVIDWRQDPVAVRNLVRALSPAPGARTEWTRGMLKIFAVRPEPQGSPAPPGKVIGLSGGLPVVAAGLEGRGRLALLEVQPPGRQVMSAADFANGYDLVGDTLGEEASG